MSAERRDADSHRARLLRTLERLLALETVELAAAMQQAAQHVAAVLDADKVDVFLHEVESDALVAIGTSRTTMGRVQQALGLNRLPLAGGGRAVRVFQTGELYLSRHADRDPVELPAITQQLGVRSAMFAPLVMAGLCRGVLLVCSSAAERFDEEDLAFVEAVAHWIGLLGERASAAEPLIRREGAAAFGRTGGRVAAEQLLGALTPRQREIAALIARGYSNAEIARELVLVPGTVANHVAEILERLGVRNRTQVAAWAAEAGLHHPQRTHPQ